MNIQKSEHTKAYVIFSPQADLPWLKVLKVGFRHCAIIMNDGQHWLTIDPLSNYTEILVHDMPADFDLPAWMRRRGHMVVEAEISKPCKTAPIGVFSCVEAVKRVLGIHNRFVITPYQLYRYLMRANEAKAKKSSAYEHQNNALNTIDYSNLFTQGALQWEA